MIFVQDGLVTAILLYAQDRNLERDDYLFPSRKGGHITKQRADQIIRTMTDRAGLLRNVHAHLFRHGYAINFLKLWGPFGCPSGAARTLRHQHHSHLPPAHR